MSLTENILKNAEQLEVEYQEVINGATDLFAVEGNPFYLKFIAKELVNIAFDSLSISREHHVKLADIRNDFLEGNIDINVFEEVVMNHMGKSNVSEERVNLSETLLKFYVSVKKQSEINDNCLGNEKASTVLKMILPKIYDMVLESFNYENDFLKDNGVIDELIADFELEVINYDELTEAIKDFYIDWKTRK